MGRIGLWTTVWCSTISFPLDYTAAMLIQCAYCTHIWVHSAHCSPHTVYHTQSIHLLFADHQGRLTNLRRGKEEATFPWCAPLCHWTRWRMCCIIDPLCLKMHIEAALYMSIFPNVIYPGCQCFSGISTFVPAPSENLQLEFMELNRRPCAGKTFALLLRYGDASVVTSFLSFWDCCQCSLPKVYNSRSSREKKLPSRISFTFPTSSGSQIQPLP